jgi:uncharacterized OB-fold protein
MNSADHAVAIALLRELHGVGALHDYAKRHKLPFGTCPTCGAVPMPNRSCPFCTAHPDELILD